MTSWCDSLQAELPYNREYHVLAPRWETWIDQVVQANPTQTDILLLSIIVVPEVA